MKTRLNSIIRNSFQPQILGNGEAHFVKDQYDIKSNYYEDEIIKMLEFLVNKIFVVSVGQVFQ